MNTLFITDSFPVPPKDGRYIPIFKLMNFLSKKNNVDLLIVNENKVVVRNKPNWLRKTYNINSRRKNIVTSFLREILLIEPYFSSYSFDYDKLFCILKKNKYDIIWISPISIASIISLIRKIYQESENKPLLCLGLNDSIYYSYFRQGISVLLAYGKLSFNYVIRLFRVPFVFFCERKLLKNYDAVCVQTFIEKKRTLKVLFNLKKKPKIIVAPNGKNDKLLELKYEGAKYKKVLLMNHLDTNKRKEAIWFVKKMWPLIKNKFKDYELNIVGYSPDGKLIKYLESFSGVKVKGFLKDIKDCYKNMSISIIYTFQNYGIINRLIDSMAAGLPVLISEGVYNTIREFGFKKNIHGVVVNSRKHLLRKISELLSNEDLLYEYSRKSREFMKDKFLWDTTINNIMSELKNIRKE